MLWWMVPVLCIAAFWSGTACCVMSYLHRQPISTHLPGDRCHRNHKRKVRGAQHLPECVPCHDLIDPIGFGFEHYDHLGRWRDTEDGHPIDASGFVDDVTFQGAQELSLSLLEDERFGPVMSKAGAGGACRGLCDDPGDIGILDPILTQGSKFIHPSYWRWYRRRHRRNRQSIVQRRGDRRGEHLGRYRLGRVRAHRMGCSRHLDLAGRVLSTGHGHQYHR